MFDLGILVPAVWSDAAKHATMQVSLNMRMRRASAIIESL